MATEAKVNFPSAKLGAVTRKMNDIKLLMEDIKNVDEVKMQLFVYKMKVEAFLEAIDVEVSREDVQDEEKKSLMDYISKNSQAFDEFQEEVKAWVRNHENRNTDVNPEDSASNVSSKSKSGSILTPAQAAAVEKAKFEVELRFLDKQKSLEYEQMRMQLQSKIAQQEAIEKVLNEDQVHTEVSSQMKKSLPKSHDHVREEYDGAAFLKMSQMLMLPKNEPDVFDGTDLTKFRPFMQAFSHLIESRTDNDADRMYYLGRYTSGDAKELVRSCEYLDVSEGFLEAKRLLVEKYDDEYRVSSAFMKKLKAWPSIKQEDAQAMEKFSIFLTSCEYHMRNVSALNQLHSPVEIQAVAKKLPSNIMEKWRNRACSLMESKHEVKFGDLAKFVRERAKVLNTPIFGEIPAKKTDQVKETAKASYKQKTVALATVMDNLSPEEESVDVPVMQPKKCTYCQKTNHSVERCYALEKKSAEEKSEFVKKNRLCFGCMKEGHLSRECGSRLICDKCKNPHPTVLHKKAYESSPKKLEEPSKKEKDDEEVDSRKKEVNACCMAEKSFHTGVGARKVAIALVPVKIRVKGSKKHVVTYAGLDNFSTGCFIKTSVTDELGVSGPEKEITLSTMDNPSSRMKTKVIHNLEVLDLDENEVVSLPVVYTKKNLPIDYEDIPQASDIEDCPTLTGIPFNFIEADVGLMIGINVPEAMKPLEIVDGNADGVYATRHKLGWALNGPLSSRANQGIKMNRIKVDDNNDIKDMLSKMYNHDFQDSHCRELAPSQEDLLWKKKVEESLKQKEDGHFEIGLPFREEDELFEDNRGQALGRMTSLKRRFEKDKKFFEDYQKFMNDMLDHDFVEKIPEEKLKVDSGKRWYITHHGVYHKQKKKIRVVFNCSLKFKGISLNDKLLSGPDLTNSLLGVLLRFRQGQVAIMGDIEKMFYQVKVPEKDSDFLRFFWFEDGNLDQDPVEYRLKVHVFGAVSSPSCSNFALQKVAEDPGNKFRKEAKDTIKKSFYVDDMLKSVDSVQDAIRLIEEVRGLCTKGRFRLTQLVSSSREVVEAIPESERAKGFQAIDLDEDDLPFERALGVTWKVNSDKIGYKINVEEKPFTKRGVLSTVFSVYDPLGLVGPAILPAKAIHQELCRQKLDWDEEMPMDQAQQWKSWLQNVQKLEQFEVNRCYRPESFANSKCQLHIFCDGSEVGYGAVAYLRFESYDGTVHCSLVQAKSLLAPLKKMTIPRLELTAARLAVQLKLVLQQELELTIEEEFFWTDSTTVLKYLSNQTTRFQRFVANRVMFVLENSMLESWRHVPGKLNPADHASRGLQVDAFLEQKDWKEGPEFLKLPREEWPDVQVERHLEEDDPEVKHEKELVCATKEEEVTPSDKLILSTSSWYRLKKRIASLVKLQRKLKKQVVEKEISTNDLQKAANMIVRYVQEKEFASIFEKKSEVNESIELPKNHAQRKLCPFVDGDGILRVGGRLSRADASHDVKHPVLIPKNHHVGQLIIREAHVNAGHLGRETTLSVVRQRFWIVGASVQTRKILKRCLICRKLHQKTGEQRMADLPEDRLQGDVPPFTNVGVDLFGPFEVARGRGTEKRYGVVFTCLSSRAMHLEVAASGSTEDFISALRRFIARRGQVKLMRSDNGRNFVGAERELREMIDDLNQSVVDEAMKKKNIEWIWNPPYGSTFGGVWEREIRSVRQVLTALLYEQPRKLTDDLLNTLFCEVEAILNSRPLTSGSLDSNDLEPLTPNHLLLLKGGPTYPPGLFERSEPYAKKRWKQVQYLANLFWTRWRKEYLPRLQQRQKWTKERPPHAIGDIVLLVDKDVRRNEWSLGRIIDVMPDSEGRIRVVKVKTKDSEYVKPISKLVLLKKVDENEF